MSNTQLSLKDFHAKHLKLGSNDLILDVRNPDEFMEGHIKGAMNIPLPDVTKHVDKLKKYDQVYIHCKRGGRAQNAFAALAAAGLNNLVCIGDAGMEMWTAEGYPVER